MTIKELSREIESGFLCLMLSMWCIAALAAVPYAKLGFHLILALWVVRRAFWAWQDAKAKRADSSGVKIHGNTFHRLPHPGQQ